MRAENEVRLASVRVGARSVFLAALMAMGGCGEADEAPPVDQAGEPPSAPATVEADPARTGIWTVVAHHIPGISAMSEADAGAWHGRTLRLAASQALSPGSHCDDPTYTTRTEARDGYLGGEFRLPPGALEPLASREDLTLFEVSCGGGNRGEGTGGGGARWAAMGGLLIAVDEDRVLAPWDGVFFELERDRDFRALGQEPFWQLEIQKGKEAGSHSRRP